MNTAKQAPSYKKVMVIDDNEIDRYLVETNVRKYFFAEEVISMHSARNGLDYLLSMKDYPDKLPQIIFLDIMMPEMDGFAFLSLYAGLPEEIRKQCTITMLSSSTNPEDQDRLKENVYVKQFISKPISEEKLALCN